MLGSSQMVPINLTEHMAPPNDTPVKTKK
jgi:hypothetical protein